jgi:hypothetical protein
MDEMQVSDEIVQQNYSDLAALVGVVMAYSEIVGLDQNLIQACRSVVVKELDKESRENLIEGAREGLLAEALFSELLLELQGAAHAAQFAQDLEENE